MWRENEGMANGIDLKHWQEAAWEIATLELWDSLNEVPFDSDASWYGDEPVPSDEEIRAACDGNAVTNLTDRYSLWAAVAALYDACERRIIWMSTSPRWCVVEKATAS